MHTITRNPLKFIIVLMVLAAMFGAGIHTSVAYAACAPTASYELWAKTGTATLYGTTSVTIWGYSTSDVGAPSLPGPQLTVNQGDCVSVTLHNSLTETTALLFQGQDMIPDTQGVAAGGVTQYIFTASRPGTFLYEAGLIPGTQHQVAMGLYGALVVRPVEGVNQAYNSPSPAFTSDAVLVLSEIDPALNNSVGSSNL